MILQSYVFGFLSTFNEASNTQSLKENVFSFIISWISTILFVILPFMILIYQLKRKSKTSKHFEVLYSEMKNNYPSKIYNSYFTLRRIVIVIIITLMINMKSWIRMETFLVFQFFALVYVITVRPKKMVYDNFIEIFNDLFYFVILLMMIFWDEVNTNQKYISTKARVISAVIFGTIVLNSFIILLISIIKLISQIISKLLKIKFWSKRKVLAKIKKYYNINIDKDVVRNSL